MPMTSPPNWIGRYFDCAHCSAVRAGAISVAGRTAGVPPAPKMKKSAGGGPQGSLPHKDGFRDHAMDALGAVDHLGDMIVDRDTRDHVSLLARKLGKALSDEKDGLSHRDPHGFLKVRVEAHHDPMGRGFCARPGEL